jgi:multiple antibiotic resistance protein
MNLTSPSKLELQERPMSILTQVSIPAVFIIFFLTLGPLKAIGPFAQATRGADPIMRQTLAWRATLIATIIVLAVALAGSLILKNWRVSVPAVMIAGSLILFYQAFQMIMNPPAAPAAPPPADAQQPPPSLALAHFPLAIPVLVTAPGITAIVAFMAIAGGDWTPKGIVIALLFLIMALNLLALLNVLFIFQHVSPTILLVVGWVMAVLQAALAAQYFVNALVRLGALPALGS